MSGIAHASFREVLDDPEALGSFFAGPSWDGWRIIAKAAFGEDELAFFRSIADRDPPKRRVRELWCIAGRRGGKDSFASALAAYFAGFIDYSNILRPGERISVQCLACDKRQARIVANYAKAYFHRVPMLSALVASDVADGLDLVNGAEIRVYTNNIAAIRGTTCALIIMDECAFYADDDSASASAKEVYNAAIPSLATAGGLLVGISTPYKKSGLLYEKYSKHFGRDNPDVLVIQAPSLKLNPTLDAGFIAEQIELDPEANGAEWNAVFRSDIGSLVDPKLVANLIAHGRHELPPLPGTRYTAFCDPSGGSAGSFTLCIVHREKGVAIVDVIRERRPPFSPENTVEEYAQLLKRYGIHMVGGDKYAGEWPREQFQKRGIRYTPSDRTASEIYLEMLSVINSGRVELLDHPRCIAQLTGLERRTTRLGKDTVSHGPGGHDDIINSVAGAVVLSIDKPPMVIHPDAVRMAERFRPGVRI